MGRIVADNIDIVKEFDALLHYEYNNSIIHNRANQYMPPENESLPKEEAAKEQAQAKKFGGLNRQGRAMNTPEEAADNAKNIKENENWYRDQE